MPARADRMCARLSCERVGQRMDGKRCQACGFVTTQWDATKSEQLRQYGRTPSTTIERSIRRGIPVSTSNEVPGWVITEYIGEVFGVVVRSGGPFAQVGANLKSAFGRELGTMTKLLSDTRQQAIVRLVEEAVRRDADAVIAMRFDVTSMGDTAGWTEVCAYGTAVAASKIATPDLSEDPYSSEP
jgi:uncharacterized protein YbjQ (UPF0145 family)